MISLISFEPIECMIYFLLIILTPLSVIPITFSFMLSIRMVYPIPPQLFFIPSYLTSYIDLLTMTCLFLNFIPSVCILLCRHRSTAHKYFKRRRRRLGKRKNILTTGRNSPIWTYRRWFIQVQIYCLPFLVF